MRKILLAGGMASAFVLPTALAEDPHPRGLEEVVVTAAPIATDMDSTAQPASVLAGEALSLALAPTIGETLSGMPGVQSTFFGPAASRPVIRGLGGDRVRILTDGLATLDASGLSEDHAVAVDPALADQVEVLRGPATLMHGSGAAGGLVNVVTNRLHRHVHAATSGLFELRGDSALSETAAAGRFDTGAGAFALHADGAWRETGDYEIPGGEIENSWSRTKAGGLGASAIGARWELGVAGSVYDTRYGVPVAEEDGLSIDLEQERLDFRGRAPLAGGDGPALELRGAVSGYRHAEIEPTGETGTRFDVDGRELRASTDIGRSGARQGTVGLQLQRVELEATGEEAFIPGTTTRTEGLFGFQRHAFATGSIEYGLRIDRQRIDGAPAGRYDGRAVNSSLGGLRELGERLALVAQLTRSERHPSATELYADGPHVATRQFEVGDPNLDTERGVTAELGLRFGGGRLAGELRAFASRYHDFIYLARTGAEADGMPVYAYRQEDSRFEGLEGELEFPLGAGSFTLALTGEFLRGRLQDGGDLPRMPPFGIGARLGYDEAAWSASLALSHHFEQDHVAALELPTDAYTMLDADLVFRPAWLQGRLLLFLRGRNLLDDTARMHTSPLKDELPLPGRSIGAGLRVAFGS